MLHCIPEGRCTNGGGLATSSRKGVRPVLSVTPVTITLHIFGKVITIRIKDENRHSAK